MSNELSRPSLAPMAIDPNCIDSIRDRTLPNMESNVQDLPATSFGSEGRGGFWAMILGANIFGTSTPYLIKFGLPPQYLISIAKSKVSRKETSK